MLLEIKCLIIISRIMIVNEDLLLSSGGTVQTYAPNDIIFREGSLPKYYFQIKKGIVKLNNYHEDGKEVIYSVPTAGHCIAETFLFTDLSYPINAIAMTDCEVVQMEKSRFLQLLNKFPDLLMKLSSYTAERMYYRYIMMDVFSNMDPAVRIKKVMDNLKSFNKYVDKYSYQFPFTRKQLASLTGLSVETVIRVIKKMEKEEIVKIVDRRIFY